MPGPTVVPGEDGALRTSKTSLEWGGGSGGEHSKVVEAQVACPSPGQPSRLPRNILLETKRFDRVKRGRPISGIKPKANANGRTDEQSGDGPPIGKNQVDLQPGGQKIASNHPEDNSDNSAGLRNEDRFR